MESLSLLETSIVLNIINGANINDLTHILNLSATEIRDHISNAYRQLDLSLNDISNIKRQFKYNFNNKERIL